MDSELQHQATMSLSPATAAGLADRRLRHVTHRSERCETCDSGSSLTQPADTQANSVPLQRKSLFFIHLQLQMLEALS